MRKRNEYDSQEIKEMKNKREMGHKEEMKKKIEKRKLR